MPTILTKKSDTPGAVPATANLTNAAGGAELAVNTADKRLFTITSGSAVVELGTNPSSVSTSDLSATVGRIGSGTITQLTSTSATITTLTATSASVTNLTATSLVLSNLSIASANVTTLTSASATITNLLATSATITTLSATSGSITNLVSSNASATVLRSTSGTITNLLATSATITTLTNNPTFGGGTANGVLYLNGSKVATSGSALVFDGSNLGLGVTPSAWSLGKALQIGTSGAAALLGYNNNFYLTANAYYDGSWKYTYTAAAGLYQCESGVHSWSTAASGTAGNTITFTQAMTLDASGVLLVGNTALATGFSTYAQIEASGTTGGVLINSATNNIGRLIFTNNNTNSGEGLIRYDGSDKSMQFWTNATERARIDSSGNLLVGTTTFGGDGGLSIDPKNPSTEGSPALVVWNKGNSASETAAEFRRNGSAVGSITYTSTSVAYNTSSDYRLKENIQPMQGALAKVAALKPCTYKWKADGSDGEGFIAHELAEVVPQCVTGEKDAVDDEGKPVYQGIDTSFLVATLTAAIQEQQAMIKNLQDAAYAQMEMLNNLKADVAALKGA